MIGVLYRKFAMRNDGSLDLKNTNNNRTTSDQRLVLEIGFLFLICTYRHCQVFSIPTLDHLHDNVRNLCSY